MTAPVFRRRWRRWSALLVAVLPLAAGRLAVAAPIDDLRRQVEDNQFERAYETAIANRQGVGDVHFDFLYGIAAVNAGHVPEGILALERHLAAVPANDRARLELAHGYFLVGEYARARSEFEYVLRYNPPAGVRENIARYLQAMALRETMVSRSSSRAWTEFGFGHDSNVNGGTYRDQVLFQFGSVSLAGTPSQGQPDYFAALAGGVQRTMRVSNRLSMSVGVDADYKDNLRLHDFNLANLAGNAGFTLVAGPSVVRTTLGFAELWVGNRPYRDALTLAGEANFQPGAEWSTAVFGQLAMFSYHGSESIRDAHVASIGATATRTFGNAAGAPALGLRVSLLREDNTKLRPDLSRRVPLVRVFAAVSPVPDWRIAAGLTAFSQDFGDADPVFQSVRSDTTYSADLTATWSIAPGWTVRGEYVGSINHSNQALYDSRRQMVGFRVRYQY